jgi:hypothetical protein
MKEFASMVKRYAVVRGLGCHGRAVASYLPANYKVIWEGDSGFPFRDWVVVIQGEDKGGFGLDDFVAPRLGSGLLACKEIDLSHPVMRLIPA